MLLLCDLATFDTRCMGLVVIALDALARDLLEKTLIFDAGGTANVGCR